MPVKPSLSEGAHSTYLKKGKYFDFVNFPLVAILFVLISFGLVVVSSAISGSSDYTLSRQLLGVAIGFIMMLVLWSFDYRKLSGWIVPLLIMDVILTLSPHLPFIGVTVSGATSWVNLFGVQFQPGEPAKLVTIVLIAAVVGKYRGAIYSGKEYLKVLGICAIPFVCIMTQPDLGTGLVILVICATILFVGGVNRKWILLTIAAAIVGIAAILIIDPILDNMLGKDVFMKDYQMNRLLVFMDDSIDPTGVGYNLKQAKIAVGSGGLLGKGLGNGTQSTLGFLPEAPTDFIFCVIAEELGFVGCTVLLALYGVLFIISFNIASRASDLFGSLIVSGVIGMWMFQILENIGMTLGLMPITGIPLPFMSYGSSFMLVNFMAIGLLLSVWRFRRAV